MGKNPPYGIKKEDRLETALGPIVNSKKLFIRRSMTDLVDEFFEHPMARHDDLMDALYYADYYSKSPKSGRFDRKDLEDEELWKENHSKKSKVYNWITGSRI